MRKGLPLKPLPRNLR